MLADRGSRHCQKATAEAIVADEEITLLTLKCNQGSMVKAVIPMLDGADAEWRTRARQCRARSWPKRGAQCEAPPRPPASTFLIAREVSHRASYRRVGGQRTRKQVVYGITTMSVMDADREIGRRPARAIGT